MTTNILRTDARRLRWATLAAGGLLVLMVVCVSLFSRSGVLHVHEPGLPDAWGLVTSGVVIALAVLSLVSLAAMLRAVEAGELFARSMTRHFRRFALLYLLSTVANVVLPPLVQLALLAAHGWHGSVEVSFDDGRVLAFIVAALLFFIARLFDEARRLDEDSRGFV